MVKQFSAKRGLKRHRKSDNFESDGPAEKQKIVVKEVSPERFPESDDTDSDGAADEEINYDKSTTYGKLISKLTEKSSLGVSHKRKRLEESKNDANEDAEGSGSAGQSEKEEVDGGDDGESVNDSEAFDSDEEDVSAFTCHSINTSSFSKHVCHELSKAEAECLTQKKRKYVWEVPAVDMSNCKWIGTGECFMENDLNYINSLKKKLYSHWMDICKRFGGKDFHSSRQTWHFSLFNSYWDILHCNKRPFYLKGKEEDSNIMDAYLMHSLNHIFKTRDCVKKNDSKLNKQQEKEDPLPDDGFLDQGFTRPKVLMLLPYRSIALRVIKRLIQLTPETLKVNVEHIDRFYKEFGSEEDENSEDNEESQIVTTKSSKPSDHQALFSGNSRDDFMIGVKFTRKSIRLYGDFYSSDIIVASPLELITKIDKAGENKELDVDYLSSIEVLIIDYADVITMQNWEFLRRVVEQLNKIPSKQHGTNVMRIRQWYLDEQAKFFRQTIILGNYLNPGLFLCSEGFIFPNLFIMLFLRSSIITSENENKFIAIMNFYACNVVSFYKFTGSSILNGVNLICLLHACTPDINGLFNHHCFNYEGKVKLVCQYRSVLPKILIQARQIYERFEAGSVAEVDNSRLDYFTKKVYPKMKDSVQGGIMLFVSSYFEFVRLRNFLKSQKASFCLLGDYTSNRDISRARTEFFEKKKQIMLYTERLHFYRRFKIRGIRNLIMYSLPERKEFYPEVVNMLEGSDLACTVLFSQFDLLRLERIVGSTAARKMIKSEKNMFVFC